MSEELKEFLRNKLGQPILSVCLTIPQRDYENDRRRYVEGVERSLLQQVLEGKNLNELSLEGNKQLVNDVKKQFHLETFVENQKAYVKMWVPESYVVDVSKYEKRVTKILKCPICGGRLGREMKFCPSCGGRV